MGCVLQQDLRHDEDGTEVEVVADDDRGDGATVHQAERSENHGEAEGDEAETTDGGDDIGAEKVGVFELNLFEETVELLLLAGGQRETDGLRLLKRLIECEEPVAEMLEIFVEGFGVFGKDIVPFDAEIHIVEDETAEETVFGVGNECQDLLWCAR